MNTFFKIASLLLGVANASAGLTNVVPYPKVKPGSKPYPTAKQGLRTSSSRRPDIAVTTPPPNMSLPEGTIRPTFGSRFKPRPSTSAGSRHDNEHVRAGQRLQKSVSELVDNESGGFYKPKRDTVENRRVAQVKLKKSLKNNYFGCLHWPSERLRWQKSFCRVSLSRFGMLPIIFCRGIPDLRIF